MTSFETTNSVFVIADENDSFSTTRTARPIPEGSEEIVDEINELLELICQNDIQLHVKEAEKRGTRIEIENSCYNLAGFDHFKTEILAEVRRVKYKDLVDMVYRLELTYDEVLDILDMK